MNEEEIASFLTAQILKSRVRARGAWGIGKPLAKAGPKLVLATMNLQRVSDQLTIEKSREIVIRDIADILSHEAFELLDPLKFSANTVTICALIGVSALYVGDMLCLVFITIRALSEQSSQVLFEAYTKSWGTAFATNQIKLLIRKITDQLIR